MHVLILLLLHHFCHEPPVVVSRNTTYVTVPLRSDGLPDYEQYVLQLSRDGANPDNNAAVLIWQALWPTNLEPQHFEMVRAELGLREIPSAKALEIVYGEANRNRVKAWRVKHHIKIDESDPDDLITFAIDHGWTSQQFPPLAEWVEANKQPLDVIVQASHRPRFYSPSPTLLDDRHDMLIGMLLPGIENMREAGHALSVRAMRHVGENRLKEAWSELMAVHRLARLTAQGHTLVEQLIGISISETACRGTWALISSDQLTIELARQINKDLAGLPNVSHVRDCLNSSERIMALDVVVHAKLNGLQFLTEAAPDRGFDLTRSIPVNCNVAMRRVNFWYDRFVATMQSPSRQDRRQAFADFEAELSADGQRVKQPFRLIAAVFSLTERSKLFGAIVANLTIPGIEACDTAEVRANTTLQLTRLAAALAVYRAIHRTYPAKLDDLVPALLGKTPVDYYNTEPLVYKRTDDGYLLYSTGDNAEDDVGDNEWMRILAGRSLKELDGYESSQPHPEIPEGTDDVSVRVPRPLFKVPKVMMSAP